MSIAHLDDSIQAAGLELDRDLILGIDLGANSLGTALIRPNSHQIVFLGVHVFEEGVANFDTKKEQPRNADRRDARLQRRQIDRRRRRRLKLFRLLQAKGLLPPGEQSEVLQRLDRELLVEFPEPAKLPYVLRAHGLDHRLNEYALGRALYHLAQRRGFKSNRKAVRRDDDEEGKVHSGISALQDAMQATSSRTLGEYFAAHVNPHEFRIRSRYTHRDMYKTEFDSLWSAQLNHYPGLLSDPTFRCDMEHLLFYQRPLKSVEHLVGVCELEPTEKRARSCSPVVQQIRLLGAVNNLRVLLPDLTERPLDEAERAAVIERCQSADRVEYKSLKKDLRLPKDAQFSIESGGEKSMRGDAAVRRLKEALGPAVDALSLEDRCRLVDQLLDCEDEQALALELERDWGWPLDIAGAVAKIEWPVGRYSISEKACWCLLPLLRKGLTYAEARNQIYGDKFRCPYTGESASLSKLFGAHPQFQIEHIIPFSRSLDDSFDNKTICFHELNAVKRNRTPWEAFGSSDRWLEIQKRVNDFVSRNKKKRFFMQEADAAQMLEDFTARHLNDTRYASRLASIYLGTLFGGKVDKTERLRVRTCSGPITAILRNEWDLNRVLSDIPKKSRNDHRHHAIDAFAVAMCTPKMVQMISRCASDCAGPIAGAIEE